MPAPLAHIETWIFDLDNTLYPVDSRLFDQISDRMRTFIAGHFGISPDQAHDLQKTYYRRFGTTLRGLMLNHGLPPDAFLEYVHAIDHSVLEPAPDLDMALAALPGRKIVFTNGSERHAEAVMDRLGIAAHFEGIFDIRAADYIPKPDPQTYAAMVKRHTVQADRAALFEDTLKNLPPAAAIGMRTVWVHGRDEALPDNHADPDVPHHLTDDLVAWLTAEPVS